MLISCTSQNNNNAIRPNLSLENTRWVLRSLYDQKIFTPESGKEAYIIFTKQTNRAAGNAGCNTFFSSYKIIKNNIKLGPVARTRMFCEQQMDTENNFIKALEAAEKFRIEGDRLYLSDSTEAVVGFEAVYMN
ncbi:MAG: META domain-containing protein [bacterium]